MNLESMILKRYTTTEKIKQGYYLRIRKEKQGINIKVYYNGIKMMEWKNGLTINTAIFVPNESNVFKKNQLIEQYKIIPSKVKEDMEAIEEFFEFSVGTKALGEKIKGSKLNIDFSTGTLKSTPEQLLEHIEKGIEKFGIRNQFKDIILGNKRNKVLLFLKEPTMSLSEIYQIMLPLLELTLPNTELHKIDMEVKSKQKGNVKFDFDTVEEILERRINIYITQAEKRTDDYLHSKTENNQEKQKQQEFMALLNQKDKQDIWYQTKEGKREILYAKNTVPFELEYNIYAGSNREGADEDEKRTQSNIKGRIDNIATTNNFLRLIEMKYGTGVIGGSNGIHKHLIDLYSCLHISKDIIFQEFNDRIKVRKEALTGDTSEVKLEPHIQYDILCVYHKNSKNQNLSKEGVIQKINDIYDKTASDKVVKCSIKKEKIIDVEPDKNTNANQYARALLNKDVKELCQLLETKGCTVKIILADEEFQTFEEYSNTIEK